MVDLYEFAGLFGLLSVSPALGVAVELSATLDLEAPQAGGTGPDSTHVDAFAEEAADGRLAQIKALAAKHDTQPALAHKREPGPQGPDLVLEGPGPLGTLGAARTATSGAQGAHPLRLVSLAPAEAGGPGPSNGAQRGRPGAALGGQRQVSIRFRHSKASAGIVSSTLKLRQDRVRRDLIRMVCAPCLLINNQGYPNRRSGSPRWTGAFSCALSA